MYPPKYSVATNMLKGDKLIAAAVIYSSDVPEPSFTYTLHGREWTAYLYQRGDRVPPSLTSALNEHVRSTAISWALVTAHPDCPPEAALTLAVIRAMERWVCRHESLPMLQEICVTLPTKKLLDLPAGLVQAVYQSDWHTAAAKALCRYHAMFR